MPNKISVVYAVHNEEATIKRSLASVQDFADEIIIVDGQSTDRTVTLAKKFNAKVISTTNKTNFHLNKQMAINAASGDLILQLDADEVVDDELRNFIVQTAGKAPGKIAAWQLKRQNLFFKTWLKKGGQYPDKVIRLFWRGKAYLPAKDVHEQMVVEGKLATAPGHLRHYANPDLASYLRKFNTYTSFKAEQLQAAGLPQTWGNYFKYSYLKPKLTFWQLFLRHRGYVDGWAGFAFAYFSGLHHRVAYLKYLENTRTLKGEQPSVYFPLSPVARLERERGVGRYGRWLQAELARRKVIQIAVRSSVSQIQHYLFFDLFRRSLKKPAAGQKLVVTVHDVIPLLFPEAYPVGIKGKFNLWWQKKRLKRADLIVTDSQASKKDLSRCLGLKPEKIEVVYLAANPALAPATTTQLKQVRQQYQLPAEYLLYVGDINMNKNLPALIKALKFLPPQLHLVMVGKNFVPAQIPEWQIIKEQIDLSGVAGRVQFLTQIDSDETLAALYSGAVAYVQPSWAEGFGLPVLEAMRCGVPVVCAANSSLLEVGGEYVFYAAGLQAEDFAAAIKQVLALSPAKREAWIKRSRAWQERFSWTKTATQMEEIYLNLI
jgi:glycosyltransferase involved in cell wall biosynthesis